MGERMNRVLDMVAIVTGIPVTRLKADCRYGEVVFARDLVVALCDELGGSASSIGRLLGKHHTTILAALERVRGKRSAQHEWLESLAAARSLHNVDRCASFEQFPRLAARRPPAPAEPLDFGEGDDF